MNKAQLAAALGANNIQFPDKATVADLRKIYADHVVGENISGRVENPVDQNSSENSEKQKDSDKSINSDPASKSDGSENSDSAQSEVNDDEKAKSKSTETEKNDEGMDDDELTKLLLRIPKSKVAMELHEARLEEELLDAKLRLMKKKKLLFELESSMGAMSVQRQQHLEQPKYKDIKHLVPLFSGSDDYDANKLQC